MWRWGRWLGHRGPGITRHSGKLAAKTAGNMGLLGFLPSIWLLCPSGDRPRGCQGPLDHGYPVMLDVQG